MLLALCFRRIANAAKSYLVVQSQVAEITTFGLLMKNSQILQRPKNGRKLGDLPMQNADALAL